LRLREPGLLGNHQPLLGRQLIQHRLRQTAGLGPEQQHITGSKSPVAVALMPACGEGQPAARPKLLATGIEADMTPDIGPVTIIQPGPPEAPIIERKSERLDQVQARRRIAAQAHDIAGIGRDFGLVQHDFEHQRTPIGV
jgi:hypothetical protein